MIQLVIQIKDGLTCSAVHGQSKDVAEAGTAPSPGNNTIAILEVVYSFTF